MSARLRFGEIGAAHAIRFLSHTEIQSQEFVGSLRLYEVDCRGMSDPLSLLTEIGARLQFPDVDKTYAGNLNAFLDWLTDLSWIPHFKGLVLVIHSSDLALARWPSYVGDLIEVWLLAAESWGRSGIPFHLVLEVPST